MSIVVYDGFEIKMGKSEINDYLENFRSTILVKQAEKLSNSNIAAIASEFYDRKTVSEITSDEVGITPIEQAIYHQIRLQEEILKNGHRNPEVDFSCDINLYEIDGRIFGHLLTEHASYREALFKKEFICDFGWWDNGDKPTGIDLSKWAERDRIWRLIFEGRNIKKEKIPLLPLNGNVLSHNLDAIKEHIPSLAIRAKSIALELLIQEIIDNVGRISSVEIMRATRSPELRRHVESITARLKPELSIEDLMSNFE